MTAASAETVSGVGPYVGLRPYNADERNRFFGRDLDAVLLCNKILSARLTILYSQSGLGKSSLLRALVIPQLEHDAHVIYFDAWAQDDPLRAVKEKLAHAAAELGVPSPDAGAPTLAELVRLIGTKDRRTLTLIFDQFEEFLTAHARRLDPLRAELAELVRATALDVQIVLSLREEFLAALEPFREHILSLFQSTYRLDPLDEPRLRDAIQLPPQTFGGSCEPQLVDALIRDLRGSNRDQDATGSPGVELPMLQLVCSELWNRARESGTSALTLELYDRMGGVRRILDRYVSSAMPSRWRDQVLTARLMRLLAPPSGIKLAYSAADLADNVNESVTDVDAALARLSRARILQTRHSKTGTRYELQHDAFIGVIAPWRDEVLNRRIRRRQTAVGLAVMGAVAAAILLVVLVNQGYRSRFERQSQLQDLVHHVETDIESRPTFNLLLAAAAHTLARSENPQLQRAAESALRRALAIVGGIPFTNAAGPSETVALSSDGKRLVSAGAAGTVLWELGSGASHRPGSVQTFDPKTLSPRPVKHAAISPGRRWLATAGDDRIVQMFDLTAAAEPPREVSLDQPASALAFSRDDRWLAFTMENGGTAILDLRGAQVPSSPTPLPPLDSFKADRAYAVAFRSSGLLLAALEGFSEESRHGAVLQWTVDATGRSSGPVQLWREATDRGYLDMAIGNDATLLAVLTLHDEVRVVELDDDPGPSHGLDLSGVVGRARSAAALALAPHGSTLAVADRSGAIVLWNAATLQRERALIGHDDQVNGLSFSADARWLASASLDGTTRLWELEARATHPWVFGSRGRELVDVALSRSPAWLVAAGRDGRVRRVDLERGTVAADLDAPVADARLSVIDVTDDGRWLAAGAENGYAFLWAHASRDLTDPPLVLPGLSGPVKSVAFSPDGRWLAMGGDRSAGTGDQNQDASANIRIFRLDSDPSSLTGFEHTHGGDVTHLIFSANSLRLAAGGTSGDVDVWDLASVSKGPTRVAAGEHGRITAIDFDPRGRLAFAGEDGQVHFKDDAQSMWQEPITVRQQTDTSSANDLAFSPDGRWLLISTTTGRVLRRPMGEPPSWRRFWERWSAPQEQDEESYSSPVTKLAFSRDNLLATGSSDGTVRVSSIEALADAVPLWGPASRIWKLLFGGSADDRFVAAIAEDRAWLWMVNRDGSRRRSTDQDDIVRFACRTAGRRASQQTCEELRGRLNRWQRDWDVCKVCTQAPPR
jgi:WD40 repeat protein